MERVSVFIITKNEEKDIRRCLESVAWADEIVVVDSGSKDATGDICREMGARFIFHEWENSNRQKQFALESCLNPWVLSIDADEVVSPEMRDSVKTLLSGKPKCDGYKVLRRNYYRDRPLYFAAMHPKPELRLFRRDRGRFIDRAVHDKVILDGRCGWVDGYLEHFNIVELAEWVQKNVGYARLCAEDDIRRGKPVGLRQFSSLCSMFFTRYILCRGCLHGVLGLFFSAMPVYFRMLQYSIMWEMQKEMGRRLD